MKCPTCGAWTNVLETRMKADGKYRRYECGNLHRFQTIEKVSIPLYTEAVMKVIQAEKLVKARMAQALKRGKRNPKA